MFGAYKDLLGRYLLGTKQRSSEGMTRRLGYWDVRTWILSPQGWLLVLKIGCLENHPMTCKWLATMVIVSPRFLGQPSPSNKPFHGL